MLWVIKRHTRCGDKGLWEKCAAAFHLMWAILQQNIPLVWFHHNHSRRLRTQKTQPDAMPTIFDDCKALFSQLYFQRINSNAWKRFSSSTILCFYVYRLDLTQCVSETPASSSFVHFLYCNDTVCIHTFRHFFFYLTVTSSNFKLRWFSKMLVGEIKAFIHNFLWQYDHFHHLMAPKSLQLFTSSVWIVPQVIKRV